MDHLRVKLPAGRITGRSASLVLRSLDKQIKAKHMKQVVKDFYIDKQRREIGIKFTEPN